MSSTDFSSLDDWLNTELKPAAAPSRILRPAAPVVATPVLIGYIRYWQRRTCEACGSEHVEFINFYACYRTPSGAKTIRVCEPPTEDLLPRYDHEKATVQAICSECAPGIVPSEESCTALEPFLSLIQ